MTLQFSALTQEEATAYRQGQPDAHGLAPELTVSDGGGNPCRHCLQEIAQGKPMLVLAHKPFAGTQPYAEVGPIFLCAEECTRHPETASLPAMFAGWPRLLMRGYDARDRIVYGSGGVVETTDLEARAEELFSDPNVAYIHLRSANYNCFQCRIDRG